MSLHLQPTKQLILSMNPTENQSNEIEKRVSTERLNNIIAGADFLISKLKDFLRMGLYNIENQKEEISQVCRRLIDFQAQGLATMTSKLAELDFNSDNWKYKITSIITKIYLICNGIKTINQQPTNWQYELLTLAGVTTPQQQIFNNQPVTDLWFVLACQHGQTNEISYKKTWFIGKKSNRIAFFIQYFKDSKYQETIFIPGTYVNADFYFYPGIHSMRVLYKNKDITQDFFSPKAYSGINKVIKIYKKALTDNPFMDNIPLIITDVFIVCKNGKYALADMDKNIIYLINNKLKTAKILSATGNNFFSCFVNLKDFEVEIISIWANNSYYFITDENY